MRKASSFHISDFLKPTLGWLLYSNMRRTLNSAACKMVNVIFFCSNCGLNMEDKQILLWPLTMFHVCKGIINCGLNTKLYGFSEEQKGYICF